MIVRRPERLGRFGMWWRYRSLSEWWRDSMTARRVRLIARERIPSR